MDVPDVPMEPVEEGSLHYTASCETEEYKRCMWREADVLSKVRGCICAKTQIFKDTADTTYKSAEEAEYYREKLGLKTMHCTFVMGRYDLESQYFKSCKTWGGNHGLDPLEDPDAKKNPVFYSDRLLSKKRAAKFGLK
uniref:Uncharacterized protein n=1 Tax=Chromera velia CCMP2878 TaxID=1169474 RepID=A0A0G4GT99_9ALVE|eukprot:Cvel_23301.t1-p1 / transcript=Cvel_23301.t1 / gene=Cvel_23301 / organism=Chromera_velia_CCMP2878 / gene_product=hypothetical protein / transcript_product=hypothetical protein / location=Cvel_scaffold2386:132-542(+) / protein_length=137 / sequence_SO=supercontig / SO=protein_coding / is_pseudo=false